LLFWAKEVAANPKMAADKVISLRMRFVFIMNVI